MEVSASRVLASTPLWYRPERLRHFVEMLRTLSDFDVQFLHFVVLTNAQAAEELVTLERLVDPFRSPHRQFSIRACDSTFGTYDLCWRHRQIITDEFMRSSYTHFMNFEDDMRISFSNFKYFVENRSLLQGSGLIPSFLRVEYNQETLDYFFTDVTYRLPFQSTPLVRILDKLFINPLQPYCAAYILDRELAAEFLGSRSFELTSSSEVIFWGVPERAAMGLCNENPPAGFRNRYGILIDETNRRPVMEALIYHLPNTFTNMTCADNKFGRLPVRELFHA